MSRNNLILGKWVGLWILILMVILLPFFLVGNAIEIWVNTLIQTAASQPLATALGLNLLLILDILLPIPSSLVSIAAGALFGWAIGFLLSWVGMSVACILGYFLGARWGYQAARWFVGDAELSRLREAARQYGSAIVVVFRAVPVLAEASVLFAGISHMNWVRFLWLSVLANAGISAVYAGIGFYSLTFNAFWVAIAGAVLVPACGVWFTRKAFP